MSEKVKITLTCTQDETHIFQQTFNVEGLGFTEVQVVCPHCKKMGTYEITWNVVPATEYRSWDMPMPQYFIKNQ